VKKKPLSLYLVACAFCVFPLELGLRSFHQETILTWEWLVRGIFPVVLALGLLWVSKTSWYLWIAFLGLWGSLDVLEQAKADTINPWALGSRFLIYTVSLGYFINPRIRRLYFDPKLHWWRTKPRYETNAPCLVRYKQRWYYPTLLNLSSGGCFIEWRQPLEKGTSFELWVPLPVPLGISTLKAKAQIRWQSQNPLRSGVGIQFEGLQKKEKKAIVKYINLNL